MKNQGMQEEDVRERERERKTKTVKLNKLDKRRKLNFIHNINSTSVFILAIRSFLNV